MNHTKDRAREILLEAVEQVRTKFGWSAGRIKAELFTILPGWEYDEYLYTPDETLGTRIADYKQWRETRTGEDPGELMEEIACLAFRCLKGWSSMKSFQSYGPQHDLVISGSSPAWGLFMEYLHLPPTGRTILVEAKNQDDRVSDSQFSRLCSIVGTKYRETAHLGVFFTRNGASGFPTGADPDSSEVRQRSLKDARATQVIFHAATRKFVVVLEDGDLQRLTEVGALPRILEAKIRDVEDTAGLPPQFNENGTETDLPPHLSQYAQE